MGEAFTAMADDASSLYWNPAGIAILNLTEGSHRGHLEGGHDGAQFGIGLKIPRSERSFSARMARGTSGGSNDESKVEFIDGLRPAEGPRWVHLYRRGILGSSLYCLTGRLRGVAYRKQRHARRPGIKNQRFSL